MSKRADALADRLEAGARALVAFLLARALRRTTFVDLPLPAHGELTAGGSARTVAALPGQRALPAGSDGSQSLLTTAESEPDEVAKLLHGWMNEHAGSAESTAGV